MMIPRKLDVSVVVFLGGFLLAGCQMIEATDITPRGRCVDD